MNVHPNILGHPKFKLYKRRLGCPAALEYLIRIWAHCQTDQRGEQWGVVTPGYVEAIADWAGEPGKLYEALAAPFQGNPGWIEQHEDGTLTVSEWNIHNMSLLRNWRGGAKGGRPKKPNANPQANLKVMLKDGTGEPNGNPEPNLVQTSRPPLQDRIGQDRRGEGTDARARAGIPSREDIQNAAARINARAELPTGQAIPASFADHYWRKKSERPSSWLDGAGGIINFEQGLENWWIEDAATWNQKNAPHGGNKNGADQRDLESLLLTETDPEKRRAIRKQLKG